MTPEQIQLYRTAHEATTRTAFARFKKARGVSNKNIDAVRQAATDFAALTPLQQPGICDLARETVRACLAQPLTGDEHFPAVLWVGGAWDTEKGITFTGSLRDFVNGLLLGRAQFIAPKRCGWVIEPVSNPTRRRTLECTLALHALFLDCDGTGRWDQLLYELNQLGLAYVAYQSGGYSLATPKWRVVIPLARPFAVIDEAWRAAWKAAYRHARVVFGALGRLSSVGFDPATEPPCNPWFLTERREQGDYPRTTTWNLGRALDLHRLIELLPICDEPKAEATERPGVDDVILDDERYEEIVDALTAATVCVPHGRRDLYMSLSGSLLDRGISEDDTLRIVTDVSLRYPRYHADKHADNIHSAETTISRRRIDNRVTRIKTLNELFPDVAEALDDVLPTANEELRLLAISLIDGQSATIPAADVTPDEDGEVAEPDWQVPVDDMMLRRSISKMRTKKRALYKKTSESKYGHQEKLLDRVLSKKPLAVPVEGDSVTRLTGAQSLKRVASMLAFKLPRNTPMDAVREILRPSISKMLTPGAPIEPWFELLRSSYLSSLTERLQKERDKATEDAEQVEYARQYALRGGA